MATQTQDPVQNALLDYMLKQQQNPGAQASQALSTLMQNPELAQSYNDRVKFQDTTNADALKGIDNGPSNPIGGSGPTNPTGPASVLANNMQSNRAMTNTQLYQLAALAAGGVNNTENNAASVYNQGQQDQTQNRGLTLQYGGNDPTGQISSGGGGNPTDNVNTVISQGGKDLLAQAQTPADEYRIANQILQAGGVAKFRSSNPSATKFQPEEQRILTNMNNGLQMAYQAQAQLSKSKALQDVMNHPIKKELAKAFLATGNNKLLEGLGLSPDDVNALRNLDALNSTSVASQSKAKLGIDSSPDQNNAFLKQMVTAMNDSVNSIKTRYGYGSTKDIPGLTAKPPLSSFHQ